jgi:hypothetical protein
MARERLRRQRVSEVDAVVRLRAKRARPVLPDVALQRPPQPVRDRVPVVGPRRPGDIVFLIAFISLVGQCFGRD